MSSVSTHSRSYRAGLAVLTVLGVISAGLAVVAFTVHRDTAGVLLAIAVAVLLAVATQQSGRLQTDLRAERRALRAAQARRRNFRRHER